MNTSNERAMYWPRSKLILTPFIERGQVLSLARSKIVEIINSVSHFYDKITQTCPTIEKVKDGDEQIVPTVT